MQTFESGGALMIEGRPQMPALLVAFACGAAVAALPPLIALYMLIVA